MNEFFYKYRAIYDSEKPDQEQSIKSLFLREVAFSNRNNFNDLFDSKIELVPAKPIEIKNLKNTVNKKERIELASLIKNGSFTPRGDKIISEIIEKFNWIIDNYYFYCVSSKNDSNLMWSHYANSHKGFCIEFKSEYLKADKVSYEKNISKIKVSDLVFQRFQLGNDDLGMAVWRALRTKLDEWGYENEYRLQASNSMISTAVKSGKNYKIFKHSEQFVESVIFGCRVDSSIRDYIIDNIPYKCKFKQAYEGISSIEIKLIK